MMTFVVCSYGKLQPVDRDEIQETTTLALSTLYSNTFEWECIQGKIMPCWPPCCESKTNLSKLFRPGNRAEVFIWEVFILVPEISLEKPRPR